MKRIFIIMLFPFFLTFGQTLDWTSLSQEVNNNVNCLTVFNGQLVAGGRFSNAGSVPANKIASWDGSNWTALGSGLRSGFNPFVLKAIVFNNELIVIGNFDSAGSIRSCDIAKWNGSIWSGFDSGSNASINSIAIFNNEVYVGGTFDTIGGVAANRIAKWNGINWVPLGTGIQGFNVNDLCVYQNELYAIGNITAAGSTSCNNIARWNGTSWNNVSTGLNIGNSALIVKNNKLIVGSQTGSPPIYPQELNEWDGNSWNIFSQQNIAPVRSFLDFNNEFYFSGGTGTGPAGASYVFIWNTSTSSWQPLGTGINDYIPTLCVFNNEIYCGGSFRVSTGANHNFIARYTNVTAINENDAEQISVYPNPVKNNLTIDAKSTTLQSIYLTNVLGQVIHKPSKTSTEINLSNFNTGVYFLYFQTKNHIKVFKIIKE